MQSSNNIHQLADHLFRRESGKMVAVLTKIFGAANLQTAEDVVQDTLLLALSVWMHKGIPGNPSAWLYTVAKNKAIDIIRRNRHSVQFDFSDNETILLTSGYSFAAAMDDFWKEEPVKDDMLKMMFACCHPGISETSQVTLILKTLCGFSTAEIAKAFLCAEDTVSKRLYRTKEFFREEKIKLALPPEHELASRTEAVLNSIYLLFNEGYNSTHSEDLIRKDLLEEALLLCRLLAEHPPTQLPATFALTALVCFHSARSESRLTEEGEIILLDKQDRSKWNTALIEEGNAYMNRAAFGNSLSRYHLEAAIAFEHCMAGSFALTDWNRILELYEWLCRMDPSPLTELNKAVVILQVQGAAAALETLNGIADKKIIEPFYLYHSLLGEIHCRLRHASQAKASFEKAIAQTQSAAEKKMLQNKIRALP